MITHFYGFELSKDEREQKRVFWSTIMRCIDCATMYLSPSEFWQVAGNDWEHLSGDIESEDEVANIFVIDERDVDLIKEANSEQNVFWIPRLGLHVWFSTIFCPHSTPTEIELD